MRKCFVLVSLLLLGLFSRSAQAQTPYLLTCVFDGTQVAGVDAVTFKPHTLAAIVSFKHGTKAATLGVEPGTCAWQDRGMSPGEPTFLQQFVPEVWAYKTVNDVPVIYPMGAPWVLLVSQKGKSVNFKAFTTSEGSPVPYLKIVD